MNGSFVDLATLLNIFPKEYETLLAFFIIFCKLITVLFPPPNNKIVYSAYRVISVLGLNIGWASNYIESSKSKLSIDSNIKK
ncbi:hypothetical protein AA106555_1503 [Neokomagataea thailandica NBRC 106555]|uniref:Uncharacterized protein n=2 Tax=Neokomagataea TaxID=1223423 RepID=A0A4Y6V847_9PROT|nr:MULTISPECIES: hypothetical protein [Neokomagataea]QDH24647.1 hypothetical protein D5366_04740 [Neokomagataea tanensis]GBR53956.1 hypothetical protein AA106555_1503 [Neokomagataea thailandica NBRC 106555]